MLTSDTLAKVKESITIDEVMARSGLGLKQQGQELVGLCPFHEDKHPSMNVNADKGVYLCRSCGAAGDTIKFYQEFHKVAFMDAVVALAEMGGVPLEFEDKAKQRQFEQQRSLRQSILSALDIAKEFFRHQLKNSLDAQLYCKSRGITGEVARDWQMGFASGDRHNLVRHLESCGVSHKVMQEAGLLVEREGQLVPKFRQRLMIPILNIRGQCVGFTGRTILPDGKPKYLNSPASPVFDKKRLLFALDKAAKSGKSECILVEGHLDAIALHRAGWTNAVASQGTAITQFHLRELAKHFDVLVAAMDGDEAGEKATQRILELLGETPALSLEVKATTFLADPDELVQQGNTQAIADSLEVAQDIYQWQVCRLLLDADLNTPLSKAKSVQDALKVVAMAGPSIHEMMLAHIAYQCAPSPLQHEAELDSLRIGLERLLSQKPIRKLPGEVEATAEERAIATIIAGAYHHGDIDLAVDNLSLPEEYQEAMAIAQAGSEYPPDNVLEASGKLKSVLLPLMGGDGVPDLLAVMDALVFLSSTSIEAQIRSLMQQWVSEQDMDKQKALGTAIKGLKAKL